jgi:hypothetical protein
MRGATRVYPKVSGLAAWGRELQMVQLSTTRCSCIAILWVGLVSFAAVTLCVGSQRVFIFVSIHFFIDSIRKLLNTPSYTSTPQYAFMELCSVKKTQGLYFYFLYESTIPSRIATIFWTVFLIISLFLFIEPNFRDEVHRCTYFTSMTNTTECHGLAVSSLAS